MKKPLVLIGGGGHCKSVIDVAESAGYSILGILDRPEEVGKKVLGYEVIGTDDEMANYADKAEFVVTVGQIKSPNLRIKLHNMVEAAGGKLATIISPSAHVSKYATVGEGTVVMHQAVVNADAKVGKGCIINTFANIEHDVTVGDYCHISTGVMINGGATIKDNSFLGSQSTVNQMVRINRGGVISSLSLVNKDIIESGVYAGSPAKLIKKSNKKKKNTIIIAEAGVNHNGSIELAKLLVDKAVKAGADYIKFQTFKASKLVTKTAKQAEYQQKNIGKEGDSQYQMLKKLELSSEEHEVLIEYCQQKGIKFFSTAFDFDSIEYLHSLNLGLWKIPSGEVTNYPFLKRIAAYNETTILSTGMCDMEDVRAAVNALYKNGLSKENLILLHCNTEYPTPFEDVNLKAMDALRNEFGVEVGYSDHTKGIEVPIAAVALGAKVIEKHFTLDRTMEGPDHKASLEPNELKSMVSAIRHVEKTLTYDRNYFGPLLE